MSFTPHWNQIQSEYPEIHIVLQRIAREIFQVGDDTVLVSQIAENNLNQAISHNFLIKSSEKMAFSNPDIRYEYLVRYAANLLLKSWNEVEEFSNVFYQIYQCGFQVENSREIGKSVLIILNHENEKDVIGRIAEVANQGTKGKRNSLFWKLFPSFCEALPTLKFDAKSLVDVLEKVVQATANDFEGNRLYQVIEEIASSSQADADVLYNEFLARSTSPVVSFTISVLLGLAKFLPQEAHNRSISLINSENAIYRRIGISALGNFEYNDQEHNLLLSTLEQLDAIRGIVNPEIDYILAQAYGNLIKKTEEAKKVFIELSLRNDQAVKNQVSHTLILNAKEAFSQSWYREAMSNLMQRPLPSLRTIKQLDYCMKYYAEHEPETALNFIETLAKNWDYSSIDEEKELPNILDTTFAELYNNHRDNLLRVLTRWFASNNQCLHLAAWKVQLYLSRILPNKTINETAEESIHKKMEYSAGIILSKQVLDNLDDQTVEYLICRVSGYVADAYSLASLLLSTLRRDPSSPDINNLVASLLADYVLYNYPRDGGDLLKYYLSLENISKLEREVIQTVLEHSNSYFENRQRLPILKEFKPPSQRIYLLRLAELKQQSSIVEAVQKRSIFSFIATNIPLKYGRSFSIEQNGKFTEPSKLSTFHHEQERPQGELIDPVGQTFQRLQWRNIGLNDLQPDYGSSPNGDKNL
jgi:hypothetical protein